VKAYTIPFFLFLLVFAWFGLPVEGNELNDLRKQSKADFQMKEIPRYQVDMLHLTGFGQVALNLPKMNWKHAETEHFYIHYERKDFARKVARLAEFLYRYIAIDLELDKDLFRFRSNIFVFRTANKWEDFIGRGVGGLEWSHSFVAGGDLFLQRSGSTGESGGILAHEMTHLIIARFFGRPPPLWLNEGVAQWYEEFGYAAYKGKKKSRKGAFRPLRKWISIPLLFEIKLYPADEDERRLFYKTSKYLTGYLMLKFPTWKMRDLIQSLVNQENVWEAFNDIYSISTPKYLEKDFKRFAR